MSEHNQEPITIAILAGTKREGRRSIHAAQFVADVGRQQPGATIEFVDPAELQLPPDGAPKDGRDPRYSEITARADAFFIVTPEYNHGYPSSLKRMLDSEFDNYKYKPVALAGVSSGPWGGLRVCEALLPVCHTLRMVGVRPELYIPNVNELFDGNGQLKPEHAEQYTANAQKSYDELLWFARVLKRARAGREG